MKKLLLLTLICALVFSFSSLTAQDKKEEGKDSLKSLISKLFASTDKKEQTVLIHQISQLESPDYIANVLAKGRDYKKDAKTGWLSLKNKCIDGVSRPFHLYIPENYTPEKKYMMLFDLHGGISRPAVISEEMLTNRHQFWGALAMEKELILAIPTGQKNAEWWSNTGAQNVLSIIDYVKRNYNLNENKVFCSGFSDGGSGCFYMAMTQSTPFAGFIALNGHPAVAQMGGRQIQLPNLANKHMYVVNTSNDQLYPAARIKPIIELMKKAGAKIEFKVYDGYGHSPQYLFEKDEFALIYNWMQKTTRKALPKKLIWETSDAKFGRLHWLNVLKIKDIKNNVKFEDFNIKIKPSRVIVGVLIEQEYFGIGVKIKEVQEKTLAEKMKLKAGDIIIGIDGKDCDSVDDLRLFLSKKTFGDEIKIKVLRGEDALEFEGKFPEVKETALFRRTEKFGSIKAEIKENTIDVKVKHIEKFELFISHKQFDLKKPIIVMVNGVKYFAGIVKPNVKFMLAQFCVDNDRKMIFDAKLTITVKKSDKKADTPKKPKERDF